MWTQPNEYVAERLASERRDSDQEAARLHRLTRRIEQAERQRAVPSLSTRARDLLHQVAARVAGARI